MAEHKLFMAELSFLSFVALKRAIAFQNYEGIKVINFIQKIELNKS